ncbi:aromatic ring-hydroxylating oxygenase subunit alpha [Balneatrix alpica]|uniref:SRPBCC family protein n=1 Tax=Balneatrix alpica TaxID=75684 RepID=A0ABV5ZDR3_9GAMM|nr:aromatic ring-hydroxylating dioxygenase subunit alpha [Balneatrix alpica]
MNQEQQPLHLANDNGQSSREYLAKLLQNRDPGYSLDQPFYKDEAFFRLDMEEIFYKEWLLVGMTCEIPNKGNYFTLQIGENPIIVVRGKEGAIEAFHNVCRHRGSRLCTQHRGKTAKLVCPYHQWTYELDGKLIYAGSEMGQDFDMAKFALKKLNVRQAGGFIFVSLSDNPPAIDSFLASLEEYMEPYDMENTKVAVETTLIEKANWKLVIENNRECYHCSGSHPELLNSLLEWDDTNDPRADDAFKAHVARKVAEWEAEGIPHEHRGHGLRNRIVRMPLMEGTVSMTMDGSSASKKLMGRIKNPDLGSMRILHLPNSWNHCMGDHLITFRVIPLGPQETMVTTKWLVHKDAVEGVDYDVENMRKVWDATNDQDRTLAEENQRGINSIAYQPGPYSQTYEFGVINFINWYAKRMLENMGHAAPSHLQAVTSHE